MLDGAMSDENNSPKTGPQRGPESGPQTVPQSGPNDETHTGPNNEVQSDIEKKVTENHSLEIDAAEKKSQISQSMVGGNESTQPVE
jgi:hypothetical protein